MGKNEISCEKENIKMPKYLSIENDVKKDLMTEKYVKKYRKENSCEYDDDLNDRIFNRGYHKAPYLSAYSYFSNRTKSYHSGIEFFEENPEDLKYTTDEYAQYDRALLELIGFLTRIKERVDIELDLLTKKYEKYGK